MGDRWARLVIIIVVIIVIVVAGDAGERLVNGAGVREILLIKALERKRRKCVDIVYHLLIDPMHICAYMHARKRTLNRWMVGSFTWTSGLHRVAASQPIRRQKASAASSPQSENAVPGSDPTVGR